ncbi:MAG: relaxase/mobilization nuclease domain-containing protein [Rhodobacteraceae bacterium]|nr:relaxase/mobilization nuclease domain-containing protein [Paracoccaceae bacterium]
MIIKFFSNGIGGGAAPVDYLIAEKVLAYDENRNLIRDDAGQPQTVIRDPLPEVLRGTPEQTRHLIDASTNKWSYTAGVISFAEGDAPNEGAQQEVIDRFEELAFAGLDADQYDCLWVRHVHEGNIELHFCTPRLELTEGKSLNIAPPGHEAAFNSLRDLLNQEHRWADPLEPDRAREFKPVRESAERAEARTAIIGAIYDQIDGGLITDRLTMIDFFEDAGFEITRRAEKSISIRDPEFTKPFKLEGVLTHENWTPERHAEIAANRQAGTDADRPRRLDDIPHEQLCAEHARHIEKRETYNRDRYGRDEREHTFDHREQITLDENDLSLRTVDDLGDSLDIDGGSDRDQSDLELADAPYADDNLWFDQGDDQRSDLSDFEPEPDQVGELHSGRQADHLSGGAGLDDTTHSLRTRIAVLRGAVGEIIRAIRDSHERFGRALDQADERNIGITDRLHDVVKPVTTALAGCVEAVVERCRELRAGRDSLNDQLEAVTERRNTIEEQLEVIEHRQSHGLSL